jgi:hypothetical protein
VVAKSVSEHFGVNRLVGAVVGLELEVEGSRLPDEIEGWMTVRDGSLRDGKEYVLRDPSGAVGVKGYLANVKESFAANRTKPEYTFRTSTHCHVNVSNLTLEQTKTIVMLYYLFERQYTEFCAKHRVGNRFCLRLRDAEAIVSQLREFIRYDRLPNNDSGKYCALNIVPLGRQGTIEFRTLEGTDDWERIHLWVRALIRLRKIGKDLGSIDALNKADITELGAMLFSTPKLATSFLKSGWEKDVEYQKSLMLELFHVKG